MSSPISSILKPMVMANGVLGRMPGFSAWILGEQTTYFHFAIEEGHLMLYYLDDTSPPPFSIGEDGHLYLEL
jgi:hypothetical protein